jgi:DNA repair protein RadC
LHHEIVSEGGITGTVADPRLILKKALAYNAVSIILCHNHPSGNLKPSKADEMLTKKIKEAAALLDIKVLDHIIVSTEGYFSFADEGLL